jgi:hypothetical protein
MAGNNTVLKCANTFSSRKKEVSLTVTASVTAAASA